MEKERVLTLRNLNLKVFSILILYPIFVFGCVFLYSSYYGGIGSFEIITSIVAYYVANISVGVGLHRLWSHNAFKTNKVVEFILMLFTSGTFQGPVLAWASDHRFHHAYTDEVMDPHSPKKFRDNKLLGFFWSHFGWMLFSEQRKNLDRSTLKLLGSNKMLVWQLRNYWFISLFMNLVFPPVLGFMLFGTLKAAIAFYVFVGFGRAIQQHATFCVNSACHFLGTKKYIDGTAGDIWWLALFLLGENWHNFHHAFPRDYRNGHKWYHFDVHKWIIYTMSKIGLATDLVVTPESRIHVKAEEVTESVYSALYNKLLLLKEESEKIAAFASKKIQNFEKIASVAIESSKKEIYHRLLLVEESAKLISLKAEGAFNGSIKIKKRFVKKLSEELNKLRDSLNAYHLNELSADL
ncbi:Acyl-CoA desaturase [Candidatus Cyrtobacter comes]|uniref:Acyl-CoA desaturase n=1 Tax=Candidatus Cyrtobacter comes TaxID=675776 RepID=A0ABU5L948_9RICK|nr:fatty acid desaturase [Candidatus Cyrtobacter comes]MDZ5762641.1 Acyl-CoA desaturase [Candidatus Cyrtobacter comes]